MNIVLPNWYGLNLDKALQVLNADVYLGTFCVKGNYRPIAIFYSANPDKSKGHKHFPGLFMQPPPEGGESKLYVTGFEYDDIKQDLRQYALHCLSCDDIIYSVNRHDFRACSCGKIKVDGGKDYIRMLGDPGDYEVGVIDFIKGKFIQKEYTEYANHKPDTSIKGRPAKIPNSVRRRQAEQEKSKS